ncbi:M20 aminoacylase family protein [Paracoccus laeviglucosivorans]|uniref:Hippurate hydrolase n=1 Tax=Paracoccus laeviglucosivorans TaxID=1197861 RepID=A0A521BHJ8_9RHOB|nr:M20 aminoacylase family protein [Paracoccus laeviglucosivorans]SMO46391.1 hippurate hydrolase [Paracoccus laeviglucosivorans]
MPVIQYIQDNAPKMREIFEDLHANPEIGFQENRTSGIVERCLRDWGFDEVHPGIAATGVVGILRGKGQGNRRIGLRADMDALPIQEITGLPYASTNADTMHACGHDGHTTMLLGAAQYLAATRDFDGTAVFIFQPAEEGLGGARRMIAEGLFEKFPVDEVYGMHNQPLSETGLARIRKGPMMAGASFFDITIRGRGSHAAAPHQSRDALVIGAELVGLLQTVVSRNVDPVKPCVLSCTQFHTGSAYNIVPETATITGTVRYFDQAVMDLVATRMREVCDGLALAHGIAIDLDLRNVFDVLVNEPELSDAYVAAAADVLGADNVSDQGPLVMGSEDFADMSAKIPGAYINVMHGGQAALHNPAFVLDPATLPIGSSIYARIIERRMPMKDAA